MGLINIIEQQVEDIIRGYNIAKKIMYSEPVIEGPNLEKSVEKIIYSEPVIDISKINGNEETGAIIYFLLHYKEGKKYLAKREKLLKNEHNL